MKTYYVTVICEITKQYVIRAAAEQQAENIALSRFNTTTRHGINRTGSTALDPEVWNIKEKGAESGLPEPVGLTD